VRKFAEVQNVTANNSPSEEDAAPDTKESPSGTEDFGSFSGDSDDCVFSDIDETECFPPECNENPDCNYNKSEVHKEIGNLKEYSLKELEEELRKRLEEMGQTAEEYEEEEAPEEYVPDVVEGSDIANFKEYCAKARYHNVRLPPKYDAGVKLMRLLVLKRAPLGLYKDVWDWHLEFAHVRKYIAREKLTKDLHKRYFAEPMLPKEIKIELPATQSTVKAVVHNAKAHVVSK